MKTDRHSLNGERETERFEVKEEFYNGPSSSLEASSWLLTSLF